MTSIRLVAVGLVVLCEGRQNYCRGTRDRKSTRLNSSHLGISYAVFCLKKKKKQKHSSDEYHCYSHFSLKKYNKDRMRDILIVGALHAQDFRFECGGTVELGRDSVPYH